MRLYVFQCLVTGGSGGLEDWRGGGLAGVDYRISSSLRRSLVYLQLHPVKHVAGDALTRLPVQHMGLPCCRRVVAAQRMRGRRSGCA